MPNYTRIFALLSILVIFHSPVVLAQAADGTDDPADPPIEAAKPMTLDRINELVTRIDSNAVRNGNSWQIKYKNILIIVIGDDNADRIRIISPVSNAAVLGEEHLLRLMQANFESALDARYAIAQGTVWAAFIHPLSVMGEREFFSGMGQTVSLVATYGTTFSSGALEFTGGDHYDQDEPSDKPDIYGDIMEKGQQI